MNKARLAAVLCAPALLLPAFAVAQAADISPLGEIVVLGKRTGGRSVARVDHIDGTAIAAIDPGSAAEILRLAPAAHIQTNSRGETLVFLRGAGERQVAVFYDGALLNIPWDNRVDLSMIPAAAIGGLTVAKGPTSVEYGANVVGGAVNLATRAPGTREGAFSAFGRFGEAGLRDFGTDISTRIGDIGFSAGASWREIDGIPLSDGADLAFNQIGKDLRTNTDSEFLNLFLRAETILGSGARLGLSVFHVEGEKGVAPEGNVAPADGPRLWRLPQWDMSMAILSGEGEAGDATGWKGSIWAQSFEQTIDSFESLAFDRRDGRQQDDDLTFGSRFILHRDIGSARLLYSFNGLVSEHQQKDTPFIDAVARPQEALDLTFRQWTISNGLELEAALPGRIDLTLGAGIDLMTAPRTGDKPAIGDFIVWNLTLGLARTLDHGWTLRASAGRKTRLPTMRELFGEALNRFLINPGLEPETAILADVGAAWQGMRAGFEIVPFVNFTDNSIDQRNITLDGRRLRQRVNLRGSRILGIEAKGHADLGHGIGFDGHITFLDADRRPDFAGDFTRLSEKPEIVARAALDYRPGSGFSAMAEVQHTGRAFSLTDDDIFSPLEVSTVLNLRVAMALDSFLPGLKAGEIFFRVNNVTDSLVEPQAGLPAAGRWFSGGIEARF